MSTRTPAQFVAALQAEGIKVVPVTRNGVPWYNHSRPASLGAFDGHGIMNHHTGPFSSVAGMLSLLWNGRSDLPGPLCCVSTAPDGTLYLVGWNRCNHAGAGSVSVINAVVADLPTPYPPGADVIDGNKNFYGNEVMHPGDRSPYPDAQITTVVKFNAAVCRLHGWTPYSVIDHFNWTRRKTDMSWHGGPSGQATRDLQALVKECLQYKPGVWHLGYKPGTPTPPTPLPPSGEAKMVQSFPGRIAEFRGVDFVNVAVKFAPGFTKVPAVAATPSQAGFECSVYGVSAAGCTVHVRTSVTGVDKWTGKVAVDVIAAA